MVKFFFSPSPVPNYDNASDIESKISELEKLVSQQQDIIRSLLKVNDYRQSF